MTNPTKTTLLLALVTLAAACGGSPRTSSATVGPQGGTLTTPSGVTLKLAPGAVSSATEVKITETEPRNGAHRRIELEPRGLALAAPALVAVKVEGDASKLKLVEIEHAAAGEVEHAIETERHNGAENSRQAEIGHLGTFEVRGAAACDVACDPGFECDDGACKPHDEVEAADDHGVDPATPGAPADDHGVDPGPAPGAPVDDHGVDPAPAPAPDPAPAACPAGMELDATDGVCKAHGGSGGGSSGP